MRFLTVLIFLLGAALVPAVFADPDPANPIDTTDPVYPAAQTDTSPVYPSSTQSAQPSCEALADLQNEASQDLSSCQQTRDSAQSCCSNPQTCSGGGLMGGGNNNVMQMMTTMSAAMLISQSSPGQMNSMMGVCQMMGVNTAGRNYNNNYIGACNNSKQQCTNNCNQLYNKWRSYASDFAVSCTGLVDTAQSTAANLHTYSGACNNYVANIALGQQSNTYANNNVALQNVCNQLAMQPQSAQIQQMQQPIAMINCNDPVELAATGGLQACLTCQQQNNGQPCAAAAAIKDTGTKGSFASVSPANTPSDPGGFNVAGSENGRTQQGPNFGDPNANNRQNQNGGMGAGMMPGSGGIGAFNQSNNDALKAPSLGRQGYRAGSGYHTDILQGERSGNGYSGASGIVDPNSGGFKGYASGDNVTNVDLKRYLPMGKLDPNRKIAGVGSMNPDVNSFTSDLFKRISDRFKLICSMNRLKDCNYQKQAN